MHRRKRRKESEPTASDLPITPMLDMSFQLMFYFIITFHPTDPESQLPLALPKEEGGPSATPPDVNQSIEDEELIIQLYSNDNGQLSDIMVAPKTGSFSIGKETTALNKYLKEKVVAGKAPRLRLEFAERISYQFVIKILDEARRAGYDRVSPALINTGGGKK